MKKLLLVASILISTIGFSQDDSQSGKLRKANNAFNELAYISAIEKYESFKLVTIEERRNLAWSYWRTDRIDLADSLYSIVIKMSAHTSEDIHNYALILRENQKYEESKKMMLIYAKMEPNDSRGLQYANKKGSVIDLLKETGQFSITNLVINSEHQDFGTTYYKDKVVFTSSRESYRTVYRLWNWNHLEFLDIYTAEKNESGELRNPISMSKRINRKFHEGPVAFNESGTMMLFTGNNYEQKSADNVIRLNLYYSTLETGGDWSKPKGLPYNSPEYSVGHASMSSNGKWLYFVSDMPGGFGGVDIYKAPVNDDGTFGQAVNLGPSINTEGNEMFPFIHSSDELLFYSTDGKIGLGGLDVFVAQVKEDGSIGKSYNLGAPINSNQDDFSLIVNADQTNGYFSSNREGGRGSDDIYSVEIHSPFNFGKRMNGTFVNENGETIDDYIFTILNDKNEVVLEGVTQDDPGFVLDLEEGIEYTISGTKEGYFDFTTTINDDYTEEDEFSVEFEVTKNPGLSLYTYISDSETKEPIIGAEVFIEDNIIGEIKTFTTNELGDHLYPLHGKKLMEKASYNITVIKEGYLTVRGTAEFVFNREGQYNLDEYLNLALEPIQVGSDLSKVLAINPIYFDLNKFNIRPDAAIELDKIVKAMNDNPTMEIELGSHTDSRGSEMANLLLSDKRAKASAAYIAERITNPERISGRGYGESKPFTLDATLDGGNENQELNDSFVNSFKGKDKTLFEKYHQYNRRTEFIVIQM